MTPALRLCAARVGYPRGPSVLRDVELAIAPGERVALVGGNGAGKTTLLKTLVGLLPVEGGGEVAIGGARIASAAAAVAAGVGLVFQNPDDQLFGATVLEDVSFGPRNQGLAADEVSRRARAALDEAGISELADRAIDTLSFGEKKRACLAGVLAMRPRVLLLDEATAGLDPAGERAFVAHLDTLTRSGGVTVLWATHAIDLVPYFADRVLLVGGGRVLADGPTREVLTRVAELERARVRAPLVTGLGLALGHLPPPLTVEEAEVQWAPRS